VKKVGQRWGWLGLVGVALMACSQQVEARIQPFCWLTEAETLEKAALLRAATAGDRNARSRYQSLVVRHRQSLRDCRQKSWLRTLGVWIRLYPCDLKSGQLEQVLDNVTNLGYSRIYVNTFYNGQVLLPAQANPTLWPSVVGQSDSQEDLLARAIALGRERGVEVHAWLFTMNFGPTYAARRDRQDVFARNGFGQTNLEDPTSAPTESQPGHVFIDPYSAQAREDFTAVVRAIAQRQPDGMVFDYIRYPQRQETVIRDVRRLKIFSPASLRQLFARVVSPLGQELVAEYLKSGTLRDRPFPANTPLWRDPFTQRTVTLTPDLRNDLWQFALAHARYGVKEFLESATLPPRQSGIPTAAVFFPRAALTHGSGVDTRLQPWTLFTQVTEWVPMVYAQCGAIGCILEELSLVMQFFGRSPRICPVFAGTWRTATPQRLPLENQILGAKQAFPMLDCVSHFAYSWLDPADDQRRRQCKL